jgi:4'-phosphopantetheinyl transferase
MQPECSYNLADAIHIWTLPTQAADAVVAKFEQVLASNEIERASRFRFPHLRDSFVIRHGVLRHLLGRYLQLNPAKVLFDYGPNGKPGLNPATGPQFNMTHSAGMAAIALGTDCQIGIDLERIRPLPEMQHIASSYFCPEEVAEIAFLPQHEREPAFFRCWTRKEAYVKAIGEGLSAPLNSFRVTLQADAPARLVHLGGDATAASGWTLHDLNLAPDCTAALAYSGRPRSLSIFQLDDPAELFAPSAV